MKLIDNKSNLELLKQAVSSAECDILICSAWIRSRQFREVLLQIEPLLRSKKLNVRVLIRLGQPVDAKITDEDFFNYIEELVKIAPENVELRYHPKLHAKFFVVDNKVAMAGSFNLTGGGFGTSSYPGSNPELGFYTQDEEQVKALREHFFSLWNSETFSSIGEDLLFGIVLNSSFHDQLDIVCLREPEVYEYVEIESSGSKPSERNSKRFIIGEVVAVEKFAQDFFTHPSKFDNPGLSIPFFEAYGGKGSLFAYAKGIAGEKFIENEVWLAKVQLSYSVDPQGRDKRINRTAPPVGAHVRTVDELRLEQIYKPQGSLDIATMISNDRVRVGFDPQEILSKHFAVFGTTGSGKSYFTKVLLKDKLVKHIIDLKGRVVVLDPHGEYIRAFSSGRFALEEDHFNVISQVSEFKSTFINDWTDLKDRTSLKLPDSIRSYISHIIEEAKSIGDDSKVVELIKDEIQKLETVNTNQMDDASVRYLEDLIQKEPVKFLKPFEDFFKKYTGTSTLNTIRLHFKKFFDEELDESLRAHFIKIAAKEHIHDAMTKWAGSESVEEKIYVLRSILRLMESKEISFYQRDIANSIFSSKVNCFDLSNVMDQDDVFNMAHTILSQLFLEHRTNGSFSDQPPTLVVVEEAHNFAPQKAGSGNPAGKILAKIAAEGRKFNLALMIITQRPAYVNKDVVSQCSSQAIFRLINKMDLQAIEENVEGLSEENLKLVPRFTRGQAVFTGVAIPEPVIVQVDN